MERKRKDFQLYRINLANRRKIDEEEKEWITELLRLCQMHEKEI
jgi:hypothetical protein